MAARLEIKDANGRVILDLSKSITRTTIILYRDAPPNQIIQPEVIKLGGAHERDKFWCSTRFLKTALANGAEYAPIPVFSVFVCTKVEMEQGAAPPFVKNYFLPLMDYDWTYLCIFDARGSFEFGSNNAVINVGMF